MVNPDLPIQELIKILRHSFRDCDFVEVEHILMDRDKKMNMEMEDLKRDLESMCLAELIKLKTEKKLERSESKCEELDQKVARLSEEYRVSCDRAKRAEELHEKLSKEFDNIVCEKNELNVKINEMKNTMVGNEQLVVELRRKQSESDKEHRVSCDRAKRAEELHEKISKEFANIVCEKDKLILKLNERISGLKKRMEENEQVVVELRRKQSEVDKGVCEKDKLILELNEKINGLKKRMVENEQVVVELRRKQSEYDKEVCVKDKLILELNEKINEMKSRIVENEQLVVELRRKQSESDKEVCEKDKLILELNEKINGSKNRIVENEKLVVELRRKQSAVHKEVAEEAPRLLNELRHEKMASNRKLENPASGKKVGLANMIKGNGSTNVVIVPDVVCGTSDDAPLVIKGAHASPRSSKTTHLPSTAREVIEISDSDDEAKAGTKFISGTSSGKKGRIDMQKRRG